MSFGEIAQFITAFAALAAAILGYVTSRRIQEVHLSINSRMDQLLQVTGAEQHAAGVKEGQKDNAR